MAVKKNSEKVSPQKNKERVKLFNEDVRGDHPQYHSGGIVWGAMLIIGGIIFLLNSLGIVSWDVWNHIWQFWPILLILWGIQVIVGQGRAARVLITLVTIAFLILVALYALSSQNQAIREALPSSLLPIFDMIGGQTQ